MMCSPYAMLCSPYAGESENKANSLDRRMDGQMNRLTYEQMDGHTNGQIDRQVDGQMNRQTGEGIERQMDSWTDGPTDRRTDVLTDRKRAKIQKNIILELLSQLIHLSNYIIICFMAGILIRSMRIQIFNE
jgi:hypothetical protein